jgi:hypothetical protein
VKATTVRMAPIDSLATAFARAFCFSACDATPEAKRKWSKTRYSHNNNNNNNNNKQ